MRIISGRHRGRRLRAVEADSVRPTPDRVRESVFNILGQNLEEMAFLDLYAGSGGVGLEASSRGARPVVLVERDPDACRTCRENIALLGCEGVVELVCDDVHSALGRLEETAARFDVVFADPPYTDPASPLEGLLARLEEAGLVAGEGIVVLQQRRGRPVPEHPTYQLRGPRHYGITTILVYDRLT
jgi:16S rRNA (guanine(966)-N(2))-methyltransferase RsmD